MTDAAADFYVSGGTLRPDALSYVKRQADQALDVGFMHGDFCCVLTSGQMGKSSLYTGLAITPHDADQVSEARFDDLRVEAPRR